MNNRQSKFENPVRVAELRPEETLKRIGLREDQVLCDIGAGSGVFTIPAAKMTDQTVYALEINDEMLSIIAEKAKAENLANIQPVKVAGGHFDLEDESVDIVLMVTVFHEIPDRAGFLREVKRISKDKGKTAVIEFHKTHTPFGPPVDHRIAKDEVMNNLTNAGLELLEGFDLGENFYCVVFSKLPTVMPIT